MVPEWFAIALMLMCLAAGACLGALWGVRSWVSEFTKGMANGEVMHHGIWCSDGTHELYESPAIPRRYWDEAKADHPALPLRRKDV